MFCKLESRVCSNPRISFVSCSFSFIFSVSEVISPTIPMLPTNINGLQGLISANKASNIGNSISFSPGDNHVMKPIRKTNRAFDRKLSEPGMPISRVPEVTAMIDVLESVVECPASREYPGEIDESMENFREAHHGRQSTYSHYKSAKFSQLHLDVDSKRTNIVLMSASRHSNCRDGDCDDVYDIPPPGGHNSNSRDDDIYDIPPSGGNNSNCEDGNPDDIYDIPQPGGQQSNWGAERLDDVHDLPPPTAHNRTGARVHSYINAPSGVVCSRQVDEIGAMTSSADSLSSDENDDYDVPPPNIRISMTTKTRSFRKK